MKNYFKIAACFIFVTGIFGISVSTILAYSGGPPDGRTGSPADSLKTCNDTACHNSFTLDSGSATFSLSAPSSYILGETLSISISFGNSSTAKHGFELSALDANNTSVGTFTNVDSNTQVSSANGINYIKHTSAGSSQSGNASWSVQWTAPASAVQDPVTFYAAGNEANGNGNQQGDYIYTNTAQSSTVAATPTPTPTPIECLAVSITTDVVGKLTLAKGAVGTITVTLAGTECFPENETLFVTLSKASKKRITVSSDTIVTDENGEAELGVTASEKKAGTAKVKFTAEADDGTKLKKTVKVKVSK